MPTLNLGALHLYYETAGDPSAPPLLIIGGLTDYTAKNEWQMIDLATDFFVIAFDNRGAGQSSTPPPGYTVADMAEDTIAVLDALDIPSAHVFGFSLGGMIALELALRYPQRVRRLILGCTTAGGRLVIPPDDRVYQALTNPTSCGDRRLDFFNGMWISVGDRCVVEQPELIEQLADQAASNPQTPDGYMGQMLAVLSHDVADRLGEISAPTLVLHGELDLLIPVANGRLLAGNIADASLIIYAEAGHLFFIEEAAAVNRDIRRFLDVRE